PGRCSGGSREERRTPRRRGRSMCSRDRALLSLILAGGAMSGCSGRSRGIEADRTVLEADGRSTARIRAGATGTGGTGGTGGEIRFDRDAAQRLGVHVLRAHDGSLIVRAGFSPGSLGFSAAGGALTVELTASAHDEDEDGFPDAAELLTEESRASF